MANIKSKYKIYNGTGWDVYHFETVASQVGTVAKGGTGYDESNQFVKGSQKDKLDLGTNTAGAFATLDGSAKVPSNQIPVLDESKLPVDYSHLQIKENGKLSFIGNTGGDIVAYYYNNDPFGINLGEGTITFDNAGSVKWDKSPFYPSDLTNKEYVDRVAGYGINIIAEVKAATTGNIDGSLSGLKLIDGVSLVENDRILVKNQTEAKDNGVYIVKTTAWTRADDANSPQALSGGMTSVSSGTTNKGKIYWQSKDVNVVGTDIQEWVLFTSVGQFYQADGSTLELSGSTFKIKNAGVGGTQLASNAVTNAKVAANAEIALGKLADVIPNDTITLNPDNSDPRKLEILLNEILGHIKKMKGGNKWTYVNSVGADLQTLYNTRQYLLHIGDSAPVPPKLNQVWIDTTTT